VIAITGSAAAAELAAGALPFVPAGFAGSCAKAEPSRTIAAIDAKNVLLISLPLQIRN
jgi:hypothetical protein